MKHKAAPTRSQACTLAMAPNIHALCALIITYTHATSHPRAEKYDARAHLSVYFKGDTGCPSMRWLHWDASESCIDIRLALRHAASIEIPHETHDSTFHRPGRHPTTATNVYKAPMNLSNVSGRIFSCGQVYPLILFAFNCFLVCFISDSPGLQDIWSTGLIFFEPSSFNCSTPNRGCSNTS